MSSIKRRPHVLKAEKSMAIPRRLLFFDTETRRETKLNGDVTQHLRLGWACYWQRFYGRHLEQEYWQTFTTADTFWGFVFKHTAPKVKLWVIARNIVFDFTVCNGWHYLKQAGYKLKFFHSNGPTTIISVRKRGSSIVFLDSMNWFVESLEKTGKRIGIPKIKINFDTCTETELSSYCKRDVLIEYENMRRFIQFLESNKVSRLCYTRGSTAMAAYLLGHYNTKIYIHNNAEATRLERESYKGGRTECFYLGDLNTKQYYVVDVNSLYPTVMEREPYPIKYECIQHNIDVQDLRYFLNSMSVVAKVVVDTDEPVYPVRHERTLFPVGQFVATLCTPELKYGLERNHIREIITAVVYEQAYIFESYVQRFYALRQDFKASGISEYEELCKKMLNSLYGKFGQKAEQWVKIGTCPHEPDREELVFYTDGRRVTKLRYLLGELWELKGHGESFDSFPAISSHVTAYGRIYLWRLMQTAGRGNYFYCDTDSLIVNETGLHNLDDHLHKTRLGGLKIEETCNHIRIRGLKDYSTDSKTVTKGIRKSATKIADGVYSQELWPSFKGLLRKGETNSYTVTQCTKHLSREYTKGIPTESGAVLPFVFSFPQASQ